MKVGFLGLGKLGLPCALAMDMKGHDVMGYDINPKVLQREQIPYREAGPNGEPSIEPILKASRLRFAKNSCELVMHSEIIFVAIQTPHEERYEGVTRLPGERKDFIYRWLIAGLRELSKQIAELGEDRIVVVISTVLPGTIRKHILPAINGHVKICYNPFFIAMGTTMRDFIHPELVLLGASDENAAKCVEEFYATTVHAPIYRTSIENAEAIKVAYNTFISMKIAFANTWMELCHKIPGTDVDELTNALALATNRIISPMYLRGGMGDGGGCHPRDNIALSWLARELDLSYDLFEGLMIARERQTEWLAELMESYDPRGEARMLKVILGKSFKPETNITVGSPALLLKNLLIERGHEVVMYDPYVDVGAPTPSYSPSIFLIGTKHPEFVDFDFPEGSVVIDPWRYIPQRPGIEVVSVGRIPLQSHSSTATVQSIFRHDH
jgi:UDPglucose 6-dehydrogenase